MTIVVGCPVTDCTWLHATGREEIADAALAEIFGPGAWASAAAGEEAEADQRAWLAHLTDHSVAQLAGAICFLEREHARYRPDVDHTLGADARPAGSVPRAVR